MTFFYSLFFVFVFTLFACTNEKGPDGANAEVERLNKENQDLKNNLANKDGELNSFIQSFNEIEENLNTIKTKEGLLKENTVNIEMQKSKQELIADDINSISELLVRNKEKMALLQSKLKKSGAKLNELEKLLVNLRSQLEEKEQEIELLKEELQRANGSYRELFIEYVAKLEEVEETKEELKETNNKLNTAFFAYGTTKELKEKSVITKEGGFIGIGKAEKLRSDFNKDYFTQIDILKTDKIELKAKSARLITTHPNGTYKLEMQGKRVERLVITDAERFWSVSKYLVIIVE